MNGSFSESYLPIRRQSFDFAAEGSSLSRGAVLSSTFAQTPPARVQKSPLLWRAERASADGSLKRRITVTRLDVDWCWRPSGCRGSHQRQPRPGWRPWLLSSKDPLVL
jgi:hypothetical protein